jgi:alpha-ribazole phosphatase
MRAAVVEGGPWDRIVSSPLQRCARFAAELGEQLNLSVHLDKDLQELHFGAWEGQSAAALMETDAEALGLFWADPYSFTPPQGEPVSEFAARVLAAIARLHGAYAGERVLLISHGGVMRLLLAQARGLPREQLLNVEVAHGALFALSAEADGALKEGL